MCLLLVVVVVAVVSFLLSCRTEAVVDSSTPQVDLEQKHAALSTKRKTVQNKSIRRRVLLNTDLPNVFFQQQQESMDSSSKKNQQVRG